MTHTFNTRKLISFYRCTLYAGYKIRLKKVNIKFEISTLIYKDCMYQSYVLASHLLIFYFLDVHNFSIFFIVFSWYNSFECFIVKNADVNVPKNRKISSQI